MKPRFRYRLTAKQHEKRQFVILESLKMFDGDVEKDVIEQLGLEQDGKEHDFS